MSWEPSLFGLHIKKLELAREQGLNKSHVVVLVL